MPVQHVCSSSNNALLLDLEIVSYASKLMRGPFLIETVLWGIFSCLIIFSVLLWIRDGIRSRQRVCMMTICVVMYIVATAHWGVMVGWWRGTATSREESLLTEIRDTLTEGVNTCSSVVTPNPEDLLWTKSVSLPSCAAMALLTVDVILSDAIVLFRACVLWGRSRTVQAMSILLFILLLVLSGYNVYITCAIRDSSASLCSFCSTSGTVMVCTSLALNLWATGIVGYKALQFKRTVQGTRLSRCENPRARPEKMLAIIFDSGMLYSACWVVVIIGEFVGGTRGRTIIVYLQESSLIQLVGMYPTVLVAIASFERLQGDGGVIRAAHLRDEVVQAPAFLASSVQRGPQSVQAVSILPLGQTGLMVDLGPARDREHPKAEK